MKIGILTYHRTYNYGGCLQALATRLILENMGHTVFYIDYWPDYHRQTYSLVSIEAIWQAPTLLSGLRTFLESIRHLTYSIKRKNNFDSFLNSYIVPFCRSVNEEYDIVIYGSDQIWRKQPILNDYNPVYFAQNHIKAKKHIAFSASMGVLPSEQKEIGQIRSLCKNFSRISVREQDLYSLLQCAGVEDVHLTLDPTLLVSCKLWDIYAGLSYHYNGPKYVLYYELNEDAFNKETIQNFARNKGLALKVLKGRAVSKNTQTEITSAGPSEFLNLIKNAEYVFSSSFHGLAFSLIYKKQVFVSFKTNGQRAKSLLEAAGISERYIKPGANIPDLPLIDYTNVKDRLSKYIKFSLDYLSSAINEK